MSLGNAKKCSYSGSSSSLQDLENGFRKSVSQNLIDEVMQEVDKISKSTAESDYKSVKHKTEHRGIDSNTISTKNKTPKGLSMDSKNRTTLEHLFPDKISSNKSLNRNTMVDMSESNLHAESLTSGYFSDSASEDLESIQRKKRQLRAKTTSPIDRLFHASNTNEIDNSQNQSGHKSKRESIYSRLVRATKRDSSVSRSSKEPIYSKLKPKLPAKENTFKPIEPVVKCQSPASPKPLVKPEPLYSKIKRLAKSPDPDSKISPEEKSNSLKRVGQEKFNETENKNVKEKSRMISLESLYSKIKKKEPKKLSGDFLSSKQPIFEQPLPEIPSAEKIEKDEPENDIDYTSNNLVTIKTLEMPKPIPCKPSLITIHNPGYSSTTSFMSSEKSVSNASGVNLNSYSELSTSIEMSQNASNNELVNFVLEEYPDNNNESRHKTTDNRHRHSELTKLVDEISQELCKLTPESGYSNSPYLDKDALTRILLTYDVPKNLRKVNESDNELRFVDDDEENVETIYADIPDYSHDEFVIALDDVNNPIYPAFAMGLRNSGKVDSLDCVSRKSAQVYSNAINVLTALKFMVNTNSSKAAAIINRMGTLAKPYTQKVHTLTENSTWIQRKFFHKSGHGGFDELRRYIKSGGEFSKELAIILHERADMEMQYAKGLQKLATKLSKASRDALGTVNEAWQSVGAEMEHEGDIHRLLASSITEEVVRPLRQLIETQHKIRKGVEGLVDKATKNLHDWKTAEFKSKKNSYHNTREHEKVQDMLIEARLGRGKQYSEKEIIKLEKHRRKAEEAVQKSDHEYYNYCIRTERARQEWESAVYKGSNCFQTLEEERLASLKDLVLNYYKLNKETAPKLVSAANRLDEPVSACDVHKDIQTIVLAKSCGENQPEQYLPDFYSEDMNNPMNKVRRRTTLENLLKIVQSDLEREVKGKKGVENLSKALMESPKFGSEESQQDVTEKLNSMRAMLLYLDTTRHKVQSALDDLENKPRSIHPLEKNIEINRDKQGFPVTVLKVPKHFTTINNDFFSPKVSVTEASLSWAERGRADGTPAHPESDYDEFSSQDSDLDHHCRQNEFNECPTVVELNPTNITQSNSQENRLESDDVDGTGTYYARPLTTTNAMGHCKALYDYDANIYDELTIRTGDVINIHEKQPDGWWVGELDGHVGIFPATYVQEIN